VVLGALILIALAAMVVGFLAGGKKSAGDVAPPGVASASAPQAPVPGIAAAPAVPAVPEALPLEAFELELAPGHGALQANVSGNRLIVLSGPAQGQGATDAGEILIVDIASGKTLSRVRLRAGKSGSAGE